VLPSGESDYDTHTHCEIHYCEFRLEHNFLVFFSLGLCATLNMQLACLLSSVTEASISPMSLEQVPLTQDEAPQVPRTRRRRRREGGKREGVSPRPRPTKGHGGAS